MVVEYGSVVCKVFGVRVLIKQRGLIYLVRFFPWEGAYYCFGGFQLYFEGRCGSRGKGWEVVDTVYTRV